MGVSYDDEMPGHCWDLKPGRAGIRCFEPKGHGGDHFNWYTRDEWPNLEKVKPTAQGIA